MNIDKSRVQDSYYKICLIKSRIGLLLDIFVCENIEYLENEMTFSELKDIEFLLCKIDNINLSPISIILEEE